MSAANLVIAIDESMAFKRFAINQNNIFKDVSPITLFKDTGMMFLPDGYIPVIDVNDEDTVANLINGKIKNLTRFLFCEDERLFCCPITTDKLKEEFKKFMEWRGEGGVLPNALFGAEFSFKDAFLLNNLLLKVSLSFKHDTDPSLKETHLTIEEMVHLNLYKYDSIAVVTSTHHGTNYLYLMENNKPKYVGICRHSSTPSSWVKADERDARFLNAEYSL